MKQAVVVHNSEQLAGWAQARRWTGALPEIAEELQRQLGPPRVSRAYLGNEYCDRRLPAPAALARLSEEVAALGWGLTLVTPPVSQTALSALEALLARLRPDSEVVFNDWGVLQLIRRRYPGLRPVLGRMLVRCLNDPRQPDQDLERSDLSHEHFRAALRGWGVERVELDGPPGRARSLVGLQAHLRLPYSVVAWGRACKIGSLNLPEPERLFAGATCQAECRHFVSELASPAPVRLIHRGTTAFSVAPVDALVDLPLARVVYDPELEF